MAEIEIAGSVLVVHVRGIDQLLAMESRIEVPLAHVAEVTLNPPDAHSVYHGLRVGANVPGLITAGRFLNHGEWAFWDVHDPNKAIAMRLHDEGYARLVIGVDDPARVVREINAALGR